MTNEQIIWNNRVALMEQGVIGTTNHYVYVQNENGERQCITEPEQIHTFAGWKQMGYVVRKGEHAIAKFRIWKYTVKKVKDDEKSEKEREQMIMTEAFFFSASQVEALSDGKEEKIA